MFNTQSWKHGGLVTLSKAESSRGDRVTDCMKLHEASRGPNDQRGFQLRVIQLVGDVADDVSSDHGAVL